VFDSVPKEIFVEGYDVMPREIKFLSRFSEDIIMKDIFLLIFIENFGKED